jgi:hypothetical protein
MDLIVTCEYDIDVIANTIYYDCEAKRGRRVIGTMAYESNEYYFADNKTNGPSIIPRNGKGILLCSFGAKERGAGKKLFCSSLKSLNRNGYTHIILNAIPIPDRRYSGDATTRKMKLMANYRRMGFRTVHLGTGLMKATIPTALARCRGMDQKMFDGVALKLK